MFACLSIYLCIYNAWVPAGAVPSPARPQWLKPNFPVLLHLAPKGQKSVPPPPPDLFTGLIGQTAGGASFVYTYTYTVSHSRCKSGAQDAITLIKKNLGVSPPEGPHKLVRACPAVSWSGLQSVCANHWRCRLVVDNLLQLCSLPVIHKLKCGNW